MSAPRIDLTAVAEAYPAMAKFDAAAREGVDPALGELVRIRASQINGCAFCLDMHTRAARDAGERRPRLDALAAWRESPLFTEAERAALALTESMTLVAGEGVPEEVLAAARAHFDEAGLAGLVWAIAAINTWNRVAVAAGLRPPG
ncbi:AhpD family alkylhydroperoxidase [Nocardiopsis sp. Huas11]|uniref:carboxymuconolactone decarboxylase family protein n=1 Tax=Nocardiopsis sp. Huas11 TaxID=2183912 RepID=UPI000F13648F|nr:carboxymuconolactone decarboxylase family protein [Nocardiopsis sp. Huas11]RKS09707.1 AhpD family alkylhydroperoxidase [Nocardiopsis sp. Huas11]